MEAPYDTVNIKPFNYAFSLICGKWKMQILFWLWKFETLRYGQLKKGLEGVTHKVLASNLKELEHDGIIERHKYPEVPSRVEYSLTPLGKSLMPILQGICNWGHEHCPPELLDETK